MMSLLITLYIKLATLVEWSNGSLFNSYNTEGITPFPGLLHFTVSPYLIVLNAKQGGIKYYFFFFFWVFGMARPGTEPQSPRPLANILLIRPMARNILNQEQDLTQDQFFCWFEFRIFILLTQNKEPSLLYYLSIADGGREKRWTHSFRKGISAMWNTNSLIQDLNSGCGFHFLRQ